MLINQRLGQDMKCGHMRACVVSGRGLQRFSAALTMLVLTSEVRPTLWGWGEGPGEEASGPTAVGTSMAPRPGCRLEPKAGWEGGREADTDGLAPKTASKSGRPLPRISVKRSTSW